MRNILRTLFVVALVLSCFGTSALAAGGGPASPPEGGPSTNTYPIPAGQRFQLWIKAQDSSVQLIAWCGTVYHRKPTSLTFGAKKLIKIRFEGGYVRHGCSITVSSESTTYGFANIKPVFIGKPLS